MKNVNILSLCLLASFLHAPVFGTQGQKKNCPSISKNNMADTRLVITTPFPIQGRLSDGDTCEYSFTAMAVPSPLTATPIPAPVTPKKASVPPLADCSSVQIGQAEIGSYEMEAPGGVFRNGSSPVAHVHNVVVSQGGKEFTIVYVQAFSSDEAFIGKPVLELMKAHHIDKLKYEGKAFGSCYYSTEFPGGHITALVK